MEIKIVNLEQNPTIKVIALKGVLDLLGSKEINRHLLPAIEEGSCFLIADLSQLEYINSTGIYALMECFAKAKGKGGYLKFISVNDRVKETLDIVGISKVIPIFNSLDEALIAPI